MPNQPSPDKVVISFQIPRPTKRRLEKLAKKRGENLSQTITGILYHATEHIELTPEDYQAIAQAVATAGHGVIKGSGRHGKKAPKGSEG